MCQRERKKQREREIVTVRQRIIERYTAAQRTDVA